MTRATRRTRSGPTRTTPSHGTRRDAGRPQTATRRPRAQMTTRSSFARSTGSSGVTRRSADSGVGVQADDEDLHDQDVEDQAGEAEQLDVVRPPSAPAGGGPGVQERGVEHPGDEGPGFHRVPAPVPAPGLVGPDRAGDDTECPDGKAEHDGPVGEP